MALEYIKLNSDTNYIHPKWIVIEATVGTSIPSTYLWIKCVSYGFDTQEHLEAFKLTSDGYKGTLENGRAVKQDVYTGVDKTGLVGTIGEYMVVKLSDISAYSRGGKIDFVPNIDIG